MDYQQIPSSNYLWFNGNPRGIEKKVIKLTNESKNKSQENSETSRNTWSQTRIKLKLKQKRDVFNDQELNWLSEPLIAR